MRSQYIFSEKVNILSFLQKYSFYLDFLQEATYNAIISHVAEAKSSNLEFLMNIQNTGKMSIKAMNSFADEDIVMIQPNVVKHLESGVKRGIWDIKILCNLSQYK
ncbi:MAG: hypothetical protein A2015_00770 [Spirochaetes bacterium GWF1_31_7]|nr:MAG: hypothetical protein A2Y30_12635 [Spirochaetes bacterium GWE1_32_154]OHD51655.1 MAG: hypothetical protein A2Y29_04435 [Spirochaetes bacterium GWE2_31_10]OHD51908.1 MAG: hypothetical protein A2015_00770 [Spirochaetes bacterium GWF1_31_7]OHD76679.1 MAG: hypothetical protein A2355_04780 [Spirochaetes bacterium RIFOXYB1_FULL_32_8]